MEVNVKGKKSSVSLDLLKSIYTENRPVYRYVYTSTEDWHIVKDTFTNKYVISERRGSASHERLEEMNNECRILNYAYWEDVAVAREIVSYVLNY